MSQAMKKLLIVVLLTYLGRTAAFRGQILNGVKATKNTLQYMASVQVHGKHACGGFLISNDYVLTAAHCYNQQKPKNWTVVLGTHNIKNNYVRYRVERICHHNRYNNVESGNDIMLLKLSKKVNFSKSIKIVKLPTKGQEVKPNTMCLVAGWGQTKTKGPVADNLMKVNVSTIDLKVCQQQYGKTSKKHLPANVICAGGYKSGACKGDSGGPLVCNDVAMGIVSFKLGTRCDDSKVPNVYTQISKFLPWIENMRRKKSC